MAAIAFRITTGRDGQTSMSICRSRSQFTPFISTAPIFAPTSSGTCGFSEEMWPSASDSKSGAGQPVAGSTPVPSALTSSVNQCQIPCPPTGCVLGSQAAQTPLACQTMTASDGQRRKKSMFWYMRAGVVTALETPEPAADSKAKVDAKGQDRGVAPAFRHYSASHRAREATAKRLYD